MESFKSTIISILGMSTVFISDLARYADPVIEKTTNICAMIVAICTVVWWIRRIINQNKERK